MEVLTFFGYWYLYSSIAIIWFLTYGYWSSQWRASTHISIKFGKAFIHFVSWLLILGAFPCIVALAMVLCFGILIPCIITVCIAQELFPPAKLWFKEL